MTDMLSKFFVPGPTWVRPEILAEMTRPMIGHRSGEFKEMFRALLLDVKSLFLTQQHAYVVTSSGTGLLEGALINCVPRRVLVTTCGAFSERWLDIAQKLGIEADKLEHEWGKPIDPQRLADHFRGRRHHYDAVTLTHNETSTGVLNDLETLAQVVHDESKDTLVLVDAVSSLGAAPLRFDDWKLDVCLASTQKGLALPPGLTVVAVSDRALDCAAKKPYRGTYFDFLDLEAQAKKDGPPFTPSIPHCYALAKQLEHILREETLERRWARHRVMRDLTLERTSRYGDPMVDREHASVSVSAIAPKGGKSAPDVVLSMKKKGYVLGSGYGDWKETSFRIGHMGDISVESLTAMLDVLDEVAG